MTSRTTRRWQMLGGLAAFQLVAGCMQADADDEWEGDPAAQVLMQPDARVMAGHGHDAGAHAAPGDAGSHMDGGHAVDPHDGMHAMDGGEMGDAPCPPDFPRIAPAEVTKAGNLSVKVVSLTPRPPRQKVQNDWEVEITDATGAPVVGAAITSANSWMEVHRHYGNRPPVVQPLTAPGHYKLDNLDFKMRGPWEVLFDVAPQGGTKTRVSIKICVE